jgi:dienelactone hydrolase
MTDDARPTAPPDTNPITAGEWTDRLFDRRDSPGAYDGQTGTAFDRWQTENRERLRSTLGFDVIERDGRCDLDPELVATADADGHERQTWTVRTEPGLRVPFYLLVPDEGEPPYPTVLTLHGHTPAGKDLTAGLVTGEERERTIDSEERDMARQAVDRGYAALAPDMRGFGDLTPPEDPRAGGTCRTLQVHAQLFGRTLAGDRTWDALRVAAFARDHADLDTDPLAVTGHSGGGAVALFAAALDTELSPAVVSSYFCAFEESIAAVDHCTCNYVPGLLESGESWDLAGLIAPRPIRVLAGRDDDIFPLAGVRRAFENLQPIYEAAGAPDACDLVAGEGGHRYFADAAWSFVDDHLTFRSAR